MLKYLMFSQQEKEKLLVGFETKEDACKHLRNHLDKMIQIRGVENIHDLTPFDIGDNVHDWIGFDVEFNNHEIIAYGIRHRYRGDIIPEDLPVVKAQEELER